MKYSHQTRILVAIDCIVFGFDGEKLKLLLIQRGMEPEKNKWSLMGGFVEPDKSLEVAANVILKDLTGLEGVYLEQLQAFGGINRDPIERTVSLAYFALIDIHQYEKQLSHEHHAEWFETSKIPQLIFDHNEMVEMAKKKLRYKAALHPILFELLPEKFTIPQLQSLYEGIYDSVFDKRNFSRKILSTGLLIKQGDKDKLNSKKGAFYYILDKGKYNANFHAFLNLIPNPDHLQFV
ncbi:ADP-ribose pyrophosphatase YjhB (NUDIX family) [Mucilaginibacter gracilis]|uniref:ADP-ribose pyrophosphatase YjhB (NUDIX family) n=1 Tax=Mucilaginibacter gracilis TaxID=423350 RepID=A0A495JBC5_9SPHI|nr:NUDIX hydrolase [Mucilaginibacter gracilis]RKR85704.1 ADP-ribose pyrophosphatase YjhB (NUDIX family) [Mucilaginibacter gracilis]